MLSQIEDFENKNLKDMLAQIGNASFAKVTEAMADPAQKAQIQEAAFQSALQGIRDGVMTYKNDPLMPILVNEVNNRTSAYANMSAEEESKLLSLDDATKKIIAANDRRAKDEFLGTAPAINHAGVRMHEKFQAYAANVTKH
jgi:mannitol-1-phosphate/altronate dehydrogenase